MTRLLKALPLSFLQKDSNVQVNISLLGLAPVFWSPLFVFQLRLFSLLTGIKYHLIALRGLGKYQIKALKPHISFWDTLMTTPSHWKARKEDEVLLEQKSYKGLRNILNNFVFASGPALTEYLIFCKSYLRDISVSSYELEDNGWFHVILRYCVEVEGSESLTFSEHIQDLAQLLHLKDVSIEEVRKFHHSKNALLSLLRKARDSKANFGAFFDTAFLGPREDYLPEHITKEMREKADIPVARAMFGNAWEFSNFLTQCLGENLPVAIHLQASRITFLGISASHPMAFGNLWQWVEFLVYGENSYLGSMLSPLRVATRQVHVTLEPDPKWFLGITPLALFVCWLTAWRVNLIVNS